MGLELQSTKVGDEREAYRLVMFNQAGSAVLVHCQDSEYHLPLIEIPKYTRPAQQITGFLRDHRQTSSALLFSGALDEDPKAHFFAVLQTQDKISPSLEGIDWFPVHHAIDRLLTGEERGVLDSSFIKATRTVDESVTEPFSRLDWIRDLRDWVWTIIAPFGLELRGFEQINGSETFCLIRFDTTLRPVWFKAVGEPNLHEFPITMALARLFPEYLPQILGSRPDCQGWLMDDGGCKTLDETRRLDICEYAADALASLQSQSTSKIGDLLYAGCKDLRIKTLVELVDPFLDAMHELMRQQTDVPPPVVSRDELSDLKVTLKDALSVFDSLGIPDTVGHGDFNPGNILVSENRCVFVDWAEAHVGHPFLTFEYLLSHLRKDCPDLAPFEHFIRTAYSQRWRYVLPAQTIAAAFVFSPFVAVYAYAVASNIWRNQDRLKDPRTRGYLRSLTRRMQREADSLRAQRVECLN
jgi:phosphotransferase family enzyme